MTQTGNVKPLVTLIAPAFNEAALFSTNMRKLCEYMNTLEDEYRWEIVVINDGSRDNTGELADQFAMSYDNIRVIHHPVNMGLGKAFMTGFRFCKGDYVVTLDIDLSYAPYHIGHLLEKIQASHADVVLASPYMKGGSINNVPPLRKFLSIWANRFLSVFSQGHFSTLTCMVRAYRGDFIRALSLRAKGMEVMPETVYKTMVMRGRIEQIPADLDWGDQLKPGVKRVSSMRIQRHIISTFLAGFVFRPFMFFILPGLLLLVFSAYVNVWMLIHFFEAYFGPAMDYENARTAAAVALAYRESPHSFIVGLLSLMLSVQLIGLGILALQNKQYFEELFYLNSTFRLTDANNDGRSG
jgi:glycosyltransferase involved in cell wall biosynthesis